MPALVIAPVVVMFDKGLDLLPEITGQVVVLQQDAVLQGLMPTFHCPAGYFRRKCPERDLALSLRVIGCASDVVHLLILEPISQFARYVTGPIVAEQARLV